MPNTPQNYLASGTIRPARFITVSEDFNAAESNANDRIAGVSMDASNKAPIPEVTTNNAAEVGEHFRSFGIGDLCLLEVGAAVAFDDRLKADADGKGVPIATTGTTIQHIGARAVQAAAASGEKIQVEVLIYSERPALS